MNGSSCQFTEGEEKSCLKMIMQISLVAWREGGNDIKVIL